MTSTPRTAGATITLAHDAEMASRLRLAVMRLSRHLRTQADDGVTQSQLSAMFSLGRLGSLTLGELSAVERVRPPTMTRIVASLEDLGMVHRTPDTDDRRVAHVALTGTGHRLLERSRRRKDAWLAARLGSLAVDDRAAADRAAELLERLLEEGG